MSKRKIETALKKKGILAERIEYIRSCPVPEGNASGWDIDLSEEMDEKIFDADPSVDSSTVMEFDDLSQVFNWIEALPDLTKGKD